MILSAAVYWQARLPDEYALTRGGSLRLPGNITAVYGEETAVARSGEATAEAQLRLPLGVSVKTVSVRYVQRDTVLVSGRPFGIKMFTDGVLVVGMSDVDTASGSHNPARSAGIKTGDVIVSIDKKIVNTTEQVAKMVEESGGKTMVFHIRRDNIAFDVKFVPAKSVNENRWKAGLWVRDSSAGIGTLTFYNPQTKTFGGLGHAVCDVDTGEVLPLSTGEVVPARLRRASGAHGSAIRRCAAGRDRAPGPGCRPGSRHFGPAEHQRRNRYFRKTHPFALRHADRAGRHETAGENR